MDATRRHGTPVDTSVRFRAPAYVRNVIERRRLLDMLLTWKNRQLVVIHAPAGYGKTTLAVQWLRILEADGAVTAWLGMHRDDNDLHWFLSHLLEAVRRALPAEEDAIGDLKELLEQGAEDTQGYTLTALLELVAACGRRFVLAVDDWHVIDDGRVHRTLVQLLDFAPPNLGLIMTSRTRLHMPLSRLRVREQLIEIDAGALRFDADETRMFLNDLNGLRLAPADVARVSAETDGWVAALQLVSLSLRESADPAELIDGFSGRHHSVGEYLTENVLSALPAEILDFLVATSVCDRLCGALAGVLADREDGQAMLEEVERRDLFLRPLDPEREWFRYHHLFGTYLRKRLLRDAPDRTVLLHRRAGEWFAGRGLVSEAVTHALAAGDRDRATDLVENHAMPLVEHSRMASLLGLTSRLPATAVDGRPALLMAVAWANCLLQHAGPAQAALDQLRRALPDDASPELRSEADVVQACIDIYGDRTERAEDLVASALDGAEAFRPWIVAVAANIQTFCDIHAFRFRAARERQQWARHYQDRTIGPFAGVYGRCFAGIAAFAQLDVDAAEGHLTDAVRLARESAGSRSHAAQLASALLGELRYERGEHDEAERLLEESRQLGSESGVVDFMIASYALLSRIKNMRGAKVEAAELLAEGARVADRLHLPRLGAAVTAERIRHQLLVGRTREARRLAQGMPSAAEAPGGIGLAIDQLRTGAIAAVLAAEGDADGAIALLEELADELVGRGHIRATVAVHAQLSAIQEGAGRCIAAERTLAAAAARALPAGLRQTLLDGGPGIAGVAHRLLDQARAETPLLGADLEGLRSLVDHEASTPVSAMTVNARERDILTMLESGRTNQQIAHALAVTVNTVKWYLKNIFTKLGASNRAEAVSVARRSGLIS